LQLEESYAALRSNWEAEATQNDPYARQPHQPVEPFFEPLPCNNNTIQLGCISKPFLISFFFFACPLDQMSFMSSILDSFFWLICSYSTAGHHQMNATTSAQNVAAFAPAHHAGWML